MTEKDLVIYRRRLPHWRLDGSIYFVTWRLAPNQADLTHDERNELIKALRHFNGRRYDLYASVVMHDHVHVLVKPLGKQPLQEIIHSWKSFTAHKFRQDYSRKSPIWQDEYLDRIVRDEQEFLDKAQYVLNNPLKTRPELEDYPWVWVKEDLNP
jgi:putative transposase